MAVKQKQPPPPPRKKKKRSRLETLITLTMTTTMVATGGFGTFPDSPITQTFQQVISENVSADFLQPFNSFMEVVSAPTIEPNPASDSESSSPFDLFGAIVEALSPTEETPTVLTEEEVVATVMASIEGTQTQISTMTSVSTVTVIPSSTVVVTGTTIPTVSPVPSATLATVVAYVPPTSTSAPPSPTSTLTSTPTSTSTPSPICSTTGGAGITNIIWNPSSTQNINVYWVDTACNLSLVAVLTPGQSTGMSGAIGYSFRFTDASTGVLMGDYVMQGPDYTINVTNGTAALSNAGFSLSNISLNTLTNGGAVFAFPNGTFTVNFDYSVWAQGNCPGCIVQLVVGMGSAGVGTTNCAYDAISGISPGASGSSPTITLTAPPAAGVYDVIVKVDEQVTCADAIAAYPGSANQSQVIGQVVVHPFIVAMYDGGIYNGNLGGRAGADSLCVTNKPGGIGNTNVHAFLSTSPTDTIANMSANFGVSNNIPVVFNGGQLIANDWSDMLDGSINAALTLSGMSGFWWSGAATDAGDWSTTTTCNGFTDSTLDGIVGDASTSGSGWMGGVWSSSCTYSYHLLCVAGP